MKKISYEFTSQYCASLLNLKGKENALLKKAKDNDTLGQVIEEVIETSQHGDVIANELNKGFADLKDDFYSGRINMAKYIAYLRNYKSFFESDLEKADIPKVLKTKEMVDEIFKYIGVVDADMTPAL
jgi:hypothetical protein